MSDTSPHRPLNTAEALSTGSTSPLIFISHDTRDADLAEAFSKLLKSVSAGMIKTFRSSDKKPGDGIDFGEEWYRRLMEKLQSTSDVICLFTERSLDRPWLLFEAGVAKGKLDTPVIGIALGVPLNRVTTGPFYQFQNMDDSETDLTKLVQQLARRIPGLELDVDVLKVQIQSFKSTEEHILKSLATTSKKKTVSEESEDSEESPFAKLIEEMKILPSRVAERISDTGDSMRRTKIRRFNPMLFEELMMITEEPDNPITILMAASLIRDDMPWLYELAIEAYRTAKSGDIEAIKMEIKRIRHFSKYIQHSKFLERMGFRNEESFMMSMEFPRMIEHSLSRIIESKSSQVVRRGILNQSNDNVNSQ